MTRSDPPPDALHPFDRLVEVMKILRSDDGCPWDRAQSLRSLKPYCVEETYEVLEAIDRDDPDAHREELGDLLLQIVFQSQIRSEQGAFGARDVCDAITAKMLRRHPHVFGDRVVEGADDAHASWQQLKAAERRDRGDDRSALDGVPRALPGLLRATRLALKASAVGFDWGGPEEVGPVVRDEVEELLEAAASEDVEHVRHELGDLLFALANLARHLGLDPEDALSAANDRFDRRFRHVEQTARDRGTQLAELPVPELDSLWQAAKRALADTKG